MRPYVSDYITTLSKQRQERISDVLEEARIGKEQLNAVAKRLEESFGEYVPLILSKEIANKTIDSEGMAGNMRDVALRLRDLFALSNLISLLLDSNAAVLEADIKNIEDELIALEKQAYNFSFLMADNQTYNYAHLEAFSDERGREWRDVTPDRSGSFGATALAAVRMDEGVLALPETTPGNYGMTAQIVASNATAYKVSDTGLNNLLTRGSSTGWKLVVATPGPVTSSLTTGNPGVQAKIEFTLSQPAPMSEIRVVPFSDMAVEVLQVTVYSEGTDGVDLLETKRVIDRPFTFYFPMQSVSRFEILVSQPIYERVTRVEKAEEYRYKQLIDEIKLSRQNQEIKRSALNIRSIERTIRSDTVNVSIPNTLLRSDRGPFDPVRFALARRLNMTELWRSSTDRARLFYDTLEKAELGLTDQLTWNDEELIYRSQDEWVPRVITDNASTQVVESGYNYYYTLGLYSVAAGASAPGFKGVFVSKPMPGSGDIGEVRLKTSQKNYTLAFTDRHNALLTSVEYSVSNHPDPSTEDTWVPILPVGTEEIDAERMFPDASGACYFRFPASTTARIGVFKDGYEMDIPFESYIYNQAKSQVNGVRIAGDMFSSSNILTCSYTPVGEHNTVSFASRGFTEVPLISAYDANGAGEEFLATGDRNTVTLSNEPYIDAGISSTSGYQPVVVRLNDGTVAINKTDYTTGKATTMPDDGYYYIHSGTTLMFNQAITQPFRVYYQYLQNNVRVRVVLRCNSKDFVSPKVDYFHLKAKVRKSDTTKL